MSIILNGTTGITTPDVTSDGSLKIDASAPDDSLVVDASGNLLLGTTSGTGKLVVSDATDPIIRLQNTKNGSWTAGDAFGELNFYSSDTSGSGAGDRGYIKSITTDTFGAAAALTFGTAESGGNATERMRIDSDGKFLVNTTTSVSASYTMSIVPGATLGAIAYKNYAGTNTGVPYAFLNASNNLIGYISCTSTSTAYITSSDYRLKEDWQPMTGATERVKALKPVNFAWKLNGSRVDGFLAHEAQAVVPEAVTGEKDAVDAEGNPEYQGIDQAKLVPLLTAALQEALAKIDDLTARVVALEGQP